MTNWADDAEKQYSALAEYAALRTDELGRMLQPYIEATDRYGVLVCRVTLVLGTTPPLSKQDAALRDLMADVFDFLYEARFLIIKGKLEVAYPLARRAYESLSLMVASFQNPELAERWVKGKEISNAEVRKLLAKHPAGESEQMTRELYAFFSQATHPNRETMADRLLGEGNEFVLGSVGRPSLAMLSDYALKTLNLWFWFGAFIGFAYLPVLARADPDLLEMHAAAAKMAREVAPWLAEQFNRTLAQEQAEMRGSVEQRQNGGRDRGRGQ